ncbi:sugar ABC transporter substrate-binding protein [Actinotalea sp. K2]|uniref:sugar ABC transporter substrate-binding protein n=1 Tax=Actinotalea sp. K2 TaxID=2939438 RepID=UPI00201815E3|nr:sugar ABC transporter substrate-binding protein [Actinotalea sp. K2]MCL3861234.1 sugar ABC transporter substrate-binding protein [Actinotalea sp. K2]
MNRTVRVGAAALAIAALGLAGCGRGDADTDGGAAPEPAQEVAEGEASGSIEVWAMGTEGEALGAFAEAFVAENPEVQVNVTAIPWDAAHDKIATAIAGGQTPDVSMIGTTWMGEFAATGALDPTPELIDPSIFFEGAWGSTDVGGTHYGVPWYVETRVLYYRSDLVTEPPGDWDGLTAMAVQAQEAGADWGITLQAGQTGAWQTFMPFAWQAGAEILTEDATEFTIDSPEFVEALAYYQSVFTDDLAPTELPQGSLEPDFMAGRIGAFVSGPWHVGILNDLDAAGMENVALAPLPAGAQQASFIGGANLAVFEDTDNRDAAWKFVEWLSRPEVQVDWFETVNDLPSVASAWDDPAITDDENLAVFGQQLETAVAPPSIPTWEEVASVIDNELERLTKTGADPQEVATAIQQQAASIGTGL